MPQQSGLTIRQHERESINLTVDFVVAEEHRGQVHFSQISAAPDPYMVRGIAVDISSGGMRFECRHFVPRMCEGTVRVMDPAQPAAVQAAGTDDVVAFEHRVKVRRVSMISHEPGYAMGLSFIDPEPGLEQRVGKLLRMAIVAAAKADLDGGGDA